MRALVLLALLGLTRPVTALEPSGLLELHQRPIGEPPAKAELVWRIHATGRYVVGSRGEGGLLGAARVAALKALIGRTRFRLKSSAKLCDAVSTTMLELRGQAGSVSWATPCSIEPDDSVSRLIAFVQAKIARAAP